MLRNYFIMAARNLRRNKFSSFISIAGFTVGLCTALLIFLYVDDELKYDSFNTDYNNIYNVVFAQKDAKYGNISVAFMDIAQQTVPRIQYSSKYLDKQSDIKFTDIFSNEQVQYVDPSFFNIFTCGVTSQTIQSFGNDISSAVITESIARKYYGNLEIRGKVFSLKIENEIVDFKILEVIKDMPDNFSLKPTVIVPFKNAEKTGSVKFGSKDWGPSSFLPMFFVKLFNNADLSGVQNGFSEIAKTHIPPGWQKFDFEMIPLKKIHFSNDINYSTIQTANIITPVILSLLGIIILVIVIINYINLTIAHSSYRFKEIGIRKISGAVKSNIVYQFWAESLVILLVSSLIAVALALLVLPSFNALVYKSLNMSGFLNLWYVISFISIILVVSMISGLIPSYKIANIKPALIIKGEQKIGGSRLFSRIFIITQFALAILLVFTAFIINNQYKFIINKDLGFKKENVIVIKTNDFFNRHIDSRTLLAYKEEINRNSLINSASLSLITIGEHNMLSARSRYDYNGRYTAAQTMDVDYNFCKTLGIKLIEGRYFDPAIPSDTTRSYAMVNEAVLNELGIKNAAGKQIQDYNGKSIDIIGVVKNFHFESVKEEIKPVVYFCAGQKIMSQSLYVKYLSNKINETLSYLKETWRVFFPDQSFNYHFLDEKMAKLYQSEEQWKTIINFASLTALFFAVIGLLGLVIFTTSKRTKEIGIRKVLGASTARIILLIMKDFVLLLAIGFILAVPCIYYFAARWLDNFSYKAEINVLQIVSVSCILLALPLLVIYLVSLKAALSNPVDSIKYE